MGALLPVGAVGAIVGAIVQVAAGAGFGSLQSAQGTEGVLDVLASRPSWFWPVVHLGFALGTILWIGGFVALSSSLSGVARPFGLLGLAAALVGTAIHLVDSAINVGLAGLADDWGSAPAGDRASLVGVGSTLLDVLHGTWASVIAFYHGVPFVLFGLAVILSGGLPSWLGWLGVIGGVGSLAIGVVMLVGPDLYPSYVLFAVVVSVFMATAGGLLWRAARREGPQSGSPFPAWPGTA